ncbi:hypothetical protein C5B96_11055 [Subtercola sp. Z020]|uniref:hypothetical protein n=1 Tax=Subtercola sp. Z020 TaxID=2080582 RepID=UPI000CE8E4E2|nr:hypothetical protein [Subtercola sp. Z020]PPF80324.1 hypothetical protein C5B96_11055 [Subtercola sp. Z020]
MTIADISSSADIFELDVLWISPDANLWVAQGSGEFIGMVEFTDGHFVSTDRAGSVIDSYSDLPAARSAVVNHATMLESFANSGRRMRNHSAIPSRAPAAFYRRGR